MSDIEEEERQIKPQTKRLFINNVDNFQSLNLAKVKFRYIR